MPEALTLAVFTVAVVTLLVIPGRWCSTSWPEASTRAGAARLASVAGIHVGTMVHVAAAALGLSALLVSSATAYNAVRWPS